MELGLNGSQLTINFLSRNLPWFVPFDSFHADFGFHVSLPGVKRGVYGVMLPTNTYLSSKSFTFLVHYFLRDDSFLFCTSMQIGMALAS